jgi:hypothetical protein
VVAATSLAAKEYALGVPEGGGRVTQLEEVEEASLFIRNARAEVHQLPVAVRAAADSQLAAIAELIGALAPPAEVERRADALTRAVAASVGGAVDPTRAGVRRWPADGRCSASGASPATATAARATVRRRATLGLRPPTSAIRP